MKKVFLVIGIAAISMANLCLGQKTPKTSEDLTLENITAVRASAAEAGCDASNSVHCEASANGAVVKTTGKGYINW